MRRWQSALVVGASAALLLLAFRDVHAERVFRIVRSLDPRYLGLALLLDAGVFLLKALKWQFLFGPVRRLPLRRFFAGIAVGALANAVLPFRLDELVRVHYFGTRAGIGRATVLGTIVIERLVDASSLFLALVGLFFLFDGPDWLPSRDALALAAGLAIALGLVWARASRRARALRMIPERLRLLFDGLRQGLAVLPRVSRLVVAFGLAALEWLVTIFYMQAVLGAFGLALPFRGNLALVAAGYLSFALPSGPGAVGVFELLVKGSLAVGLAIDPDTALACALTLHFMLVVPISLAGAAFLFAEGVSPWRLRELGATAPPPLGEGSA